MTTLKGLVASLLILVISITNIGAVVRPTEQRVLNDTQLDNNLKVLKIVVRDPCAYVLAISSDRWLWLYQALLKDDGHWVKVAGQGSPIVDKPKKFFRPNRTNLKYSLSHPHGNLGEREYQFDWCLSGYTTDMQVTSFRIKTKSGYIPMEPIGGQYFMHILSEFEHEKFLEVQGLNSKGEVIQRDNGLDEEKSRQWSPRHSEFY